MQVAKKTHSHQSLSTKYEVLNTAQLYLARSSVFAHPHIAETWELTCHSPIDSVRIQDFSLSCCGFFFLFSVHLRLGKVKTATTTATARLSPVELLRSGNSSRTKASFFRTGEEDVAGKAPVWRCLVPACEGSMRATCRLSWDQMCGREFRMQMRLCKPPQREVEQHIDLKKTLDRTLSQKCAFYPSLLRTCCTYTPNSCSPLASIINQCHFPPFARVQNPFESHVIRPSTIIFSIYSVLPPDEL